MCSSLHLNVRELCACFLGVCTVAMAPALSTEVTTPDEAHEEDWAGRTEAKVLKRTWFNLSVYKAQVVCCTCLSVAAAGEKVDVIEQLIHVLILKHLVYFMQAWMGLLPYGQMKIYSTWFQHFLPQPFTKIHLDFLLSTSLLLFCVTLYPVLHILTVLWTYFTADFTNFLYCYKHIASE